MAFCTLAILCTVIQAVLQIALCKVIPLPPGVRAEGIAHAAGTNYLAADFSTGDIYLIDIASGLITTAVRAPTPRFGIGLYATNRFIVNAGAGPVRGAPSAALHVYDIVTGKQAGSCDIDNGVFVNDVVADSAYAYYTDSGQPAIYKLALNQLPACNITRIQLPPAFAGDGFRGNGIIKFKGGLVVVHSALGALFFVDLLLDNKVTRITGDNAILNPDGIDIVKRRSRYLLYVAQNRLNLISEWIIVMTPDRKVFIRNTNQFSRQADFQTPTTVAVNGRTAVVANFNFDAPENTTELYTISSFRF